MDQKRAFTPSVITLGITKYFLPVGVNNTINPFVSDINQK